MLRRQITDYFVRRSVGCVVRPQGGWTCLWQKLVINYTKDIDDLVNVLMLVSRHRALRNNEVDEGRSSSEDESGGEGNEGWLILVFALIMYIFLHLFRWNLMPVCNNFLISRLESNHLLISTRKGYWETQPSGNNFVIVFTATWSVNSLSVKTSAPRLQSCQSCISLISTLSKNSAPKKRLWKSGKTREDVPNESWTTGGVAEEAGPSVWTSPNQMCCQRQGRPAPAFQPDPLTCNANRNQLHTLLHWVTRLFVGLHHLNHCRASVGFYHF